MSEGDKREPWTLQELAALWDTPYGEWPEWAQEKSRYWQRRIREQNEPPAPPAEAYGREYEERSVEFWGEEGRAKP